MKKQQKKWMLKCDRVWSDIIRQVEVCEICGIGGTPRQDGTPVKGLQAHHILEKGGTGGKAIWRNKFRHDVSNGICLCDKCHSKYQQDLGPHGTSDARKRWWEWLEENRNGQYVHYIDIREDKRMDMADYEVVYYELIEMLESFKGE